MATKDDQRNPSANDKAGAEGRDVGTPTQIAENLAHGDPHSPGVAMAQKGEFRPSGKHPGGVYESLSHEYQDEKEGRGEQGNSDESQDKA